MGHRLGNAKMLQDISKQTRANTPGVRGGGLRPGFGKNALVLNLFEPVTP